MYLNKALDQTARAAIAAEKAAARGAAPRKRKGAHQRGGCCARWLLWPSLWLSLLALLFAAVVAAAIALVPAEEWHGGLEAAKRGEVDLTIAFIRRGLATLQRTAEARAEPLTAELRASWRGAVSAADVRS